MGDGRPRSVPFGRETLLARFIRLCADTFTQPSVSEAGALVVNRVSEIVPLDRAVLVRLAAGGPAIQAVTGGGTVAPDSAFAAAVTQLRRMYGTRPEAVIVPPASRERNAALTRLDDIQKSMGGTHVLWLPLWRTRDNSLPPEHALWLERWHDRPWEKGDVEMLQHAALFFGHALSREKAVTRGGRRFRKWGLATILALLFLFPVNASVSAPARVVPDRPYYVFAPMDGIVKDLFVQPGQRVRPGDPLFRYDARVLDQRLEEAYQNVAVAKAKMAKLEGAAHRDPDARAELAVQELEVRRAEAEADFFRRQRERADVRSAREGVIVLDDPDALVGAAVQTGQTVLSVADPEKTRIRVMVPASDIGLLHQGARVSVSLDSDPLKRYGAALTRVGFEVTVSETGVASVMAEAIWLEEVPRVHPGQKGTVRVFGDTTVLGWQILRKPYIRVKTLLGF